MTDPLVQPWGLLLPQSVMSSPFVAVLATFVAINTVMYLSLAVAKLLPKIYLSDHLGGAERRRTNRSIHPHRAV